MVGIGGEQLKLASDQFESLGAECCFDTGTAEARNTSFDLPRTLVLADAEAIAPGSFG